MGKYRIKFWFEHGGECLWGANDAAKEKYGYCINKNSIPISKALVDKLAKLETEYSSYIDWDNPSKASKWSREQKLDFIVESTKVYFLLSDELGSGYEIINSVSSCV